MKKIDISHHISQQFNQELEDIRNRVLTMGGMVEQQIADAVSALVEANSALAQQVIDNDHKINGFEVSIDEECTQVLARRQPTASDLRLIIAVIKTITDLERIGDQAEKVARIGLHLTKFEPPKNQFLEIQDLGERVRKNLHDALDAFARMDTEAALHITLEDEKIDHEYEGVL